MLENSSNHQLLVNLSLTLMFIMSVTSAVVANWLKYLMLLNLSVPVTQLILSFVIPLESLFLILLVIFSQSNLFINLLMWNENVFMNNLLLIKTNTNMILQNQLVSWIFWLYPYIFMIFLLFIFHLNFSNNNVDNCFKDYVKCNNFSTMKFLTSNSFTCREFNSVAIFNTPHTNVLSSSIRFYHLFLFLWIFFFYKQCFL